MVYTSKEFRNNNYFILYDLSDNCICYFDNFNELSKYIDLRLADLVRSFKKHLEYAPIVINNALYKLYTFRKDE